MPKKLNTHPMWQKEKPKKQSLVKKILGAFSFFLTPPSAKQRIMEQRLKHQSLNPFGF